MQPAAYQGAQGSGSLREYLRHTAAQTATGRALERMLHPGPRHVPEREQRRGREAEHEPAAAQAAKVPRVAGPSQQPEAGSQADAAAAPRPVPAAQAPPPEPADIASTADFEALLARFNASACGVLLSAGWPPDPTFSEQDLRELLPRLWQKAVEKGFQLHYPKTLDDITAGLQYAFKLYDKSNEQQQQQQQQQQHTRPPTQQPPAAPTLAAAAVPRGPSAASAPVQNTAPRVIAPQAVHMPPVAVQHTAPGIAMQQAMHVAHAVALSAAHAAAVSAAQQAAAASGAMLRPTMPPAAMSLPQQALAMGVRGSSLPANATRLPTAAVHAAPALAKGAVGHAVPAAAQPEAAVMGPGIAALPPGPVLPPVVPSVQAAIAQLQHHRQQQQWQQQQWQQQQQQAHSNGQAAATAGAARPAGPNATAAMLGRPNYVQQSSRLAATLAEQGVEVGHRAQAGQAQAAQLASGRPITGQSAQIEPARASTGQVGARTGVEPAMPTAAQAPGGVAALQHVWQEVQQPEQQQQQQQQVAPPAEGQAVQRADTARPSEKLLQAAKAEAARGKPVVKQLVQALGAVLDAYHVQRLAGASKRFKDSQLQNAAVNLFGLLKEEDQALLARAGTSVLMGILAKMAIFQQETEAKMANVVAEVRKEIKVLRQVERGSSAAAAHTVCRPMRLAVGRVDPDYAHAGPGAAAQSDGQGGAGAAVPSDVQVAGAAAQDSGQAGVGTEEGPSTAGQQQLHSVQVSDMELDWLIAHRHNPHMLKAYEAFLKGLLNKQAGSNGDGAAIHAGESAAAAGSGAEVAGGAAAATNVGASAAANAGVEAAVGVPASGPQQQQQQPGAPSSAPPRPRAGSGEGKRQQLCQRMQAAIEKMERQLTGGARARAGEAPYSQQQQQQHP